MKTTLVVLNELETLVFNNDNIEQLRMNLIPSMFGSVNTEVEWTISELIKTGTVLFADDPALMLYVEQWPFNDDSSGATIHENKYYGFGDAGSMAGSFEGYDTIEEIKTDLIKCAYNMDSVGYLQSDLGDSSIAVMNGRDFVNQLYILDLPTNYGSWSKM